MKRLLLVAYAFPPDASPGAQRPGYLAKYLPQFGWEAAVVTRPAGDPTRAESAAAKPTRMPPNSPLRAFLRAAKESILIPDLAAPWIPYALKTGRELLARERFDAILGTALPASVHVAAGILARESGLPWIADYRDPWSGNRYVHRNALRRAIEYYGERRLLGRADVITTISEPIADQLRTVHDREDVVVIPNAYDAAEWDGLVLERPADFRLCYTGSMYDGKRSPDLLFSAIDRLRSEQHPAGLDIRIDFYGPSSSNVLPAAQAHGIVDAVSYHGVVPRRNAMQAQGRSAALLIFLNMDPATTTETGSKYLEYLGARKPIVAFGPPNSALRGIIERGRLGYFASNLDEATTALKSLYERYLLAEGSIVPDPRQFPNAIDLADAFATQLDEVTAGRSQARVA